MSFWEKHEGLGCILILLFVFAACLVIGKATEKYPNGRTYFECWNCGIEVDGKAKYFDEDENPLCSDCYIKLLEDEMEEN